jgi:hypothetical protein
LVSSTFKLRNPQRWLADLTAYRILKLDRLTSLVAWMIITVEAGLGLTLMLQLWPRAAALAATLLFGTFLGATSYAIATKRKTSCGCFGALSNHSPLGKGTILRLIVLAGLAGSSFTYLSSTRSHTGDDVSGWLTAFGSGVLLGAPLVLVFFLVDLTTQSIRVLRRPGIHTAVHSQAHQEALR